MVDAVTAKTMIAQANVFASSFDLQVSLKPAVMLHAFGGAVTDNHNTVILLQLYLPNARFVSGLTTS